LSTTAPVGCSTFAPRDGFQGSGLAAHLLFWRHELLRYSHRVDHLAAVHTRVGREHSHKLEDLTGNPSIPAFESYACVEHRHKESTRKVTQGHPGTVTVSASQHDVGLR